MQLLQCQAIPGLRYIADGATPLIDEPDLEQSFVAHSPDELKYKDYLKPEGHLAGPLWMPFWELAEMEALRAKHYSERVTSQEVGPPNA